VHSTAATLGTTMAIRTPVLLSLLLYADESKPEKTKIELLYLRYIYYMLIKYPTD
jgi:hypothetical protein